MTLEELKAAAFTCPPNQFVRPPETLPSRVWLGDPRHPDWVHCPECLQWHLKLLCLDGVPYGDGPPRCTVRAPAKMEGE